jgi:hypothetical protein
MVFMADAVGLLRTCARKEADSWLPGTSGGDHTTTWPKPVTDLLQKRLACSPPCPYSFAASGLHAFKPDHAQVRRWAMQPLCPWWPNVWSVRTKLKIGADGRIPIGTDRLRVERPPGTKIVLCLRPTGHRSVLDTQPNKDQNPVLLFTNRPN